MDKADNLKNILKALRSELPAMQATLKTFVCAESPSTEKAAADVCAAIVAKHWGNTGARVELVEQKYRGAHVRIAYATGSAAAAKGQILVLGHYDTVYASGTLQKMPFKIKNGRVFGPGVFDMKAGIVQALYALRVIQETKSKLSKRIVFLWTSDEEIGSETSRKLLESEARRSDAVFVLEPSLGPKGLLKTARKGVGEAEILVRGRSSHAGLAPEKGVNAIHELALQLARVRKWNDSQRGISLNAGIVSGGTRSNVIPDEAHAVIDLRALRLADMRKMESRLRNLRPILPGARVEVRGGFSRAPLERKHSAALFAEAQSLGDKMGLALGECTAGGGSDGNFTAALGVPTLDGLGAVGDGAHSPGEFVSANAMPERAALLAALLLSV
ncbi:MAG TPA: M20 family metallopeptidase [Candidatus Acidoferrum sp.]|nr:M20 family metallopeptidase [Candidatus Acidoferrum sp.]